MAPATPSGVPSKLRMHKSLCPVWCSRASILAFSNERHMVTPNAA